MIFIGRDCEEEAVLKVYACAELRMTHYLPQLLRPRHLLRQCMLSPRQSLFQWAEANAKRQARRVPGDGHAVNAAACETMVEMIKEVPGCLDVFFLQKCYWHSLAFP